MWANLSFVFVIQDAQKKNPNKQKRLWGGVNAKLGCLKPACPAGVDRFQTAVVTQFRVMALRTGLLLLMILWAGEWFH